MARSGAVNGTRGPWLPVLPALTLVLLGLPVVSDGASAQDRTTRDPPLVSGTVVEPGSAPVLGALVALETPDGHRLRSVLTDRDGRFRMPAPGPGEFRLRVERLGYRPVLTDPFSLTAGEIRQPIVEVTGDPIRLREMDVVVEADRRCSVSPEEGSLLADLWEQANQAFRRVEVTDAEGAYRFQLRRHRRSMDIPTLRVLEERRLPGGPHHRSFESAPVEELLREGWIRRGEGTDLHYFGPDLPVLLSPEFQRAFCFRIQGDPERPDRVGIAFEPDRPPRVPSIRGVLWMHGESLVLEELAFTYTRHPVSAEMPPVLLELFGGRVEFRGLPDGRWVVDGWVLRMPEFRRTGGTPARLPAGGVDDPAHRELMRRTVQRAPRTWQEMILDGRLRFLEEGGEVERIRTREGVLLPGREEAVLAGIVRDSLQAPVQPLEGARVRIQGTDLDARTNRAGRFRIAAPLAGVYRVSVEHPVLDSLGIGPLDAVDVSLRPGLVEEVELALPSRRTLMARPCTEGDPEAAGILVGQVLDETLRSPVPGATVRIRPAQPGADLPSFSVPVAADGTFRFCRVPPAAEYELVASAYGNEGAPRRLVVVEEGRILELDALVDLGQRGRIVGRIREGDSGPWVSGATLFLQGPDPRTATSDRDGRFRIQDVRPGIYGVRIEHLAYREVEASLEVPPGGATVTLELRVLRDAIALEPIHVEVEARSPRLLQVGYYERQRAESGTFIGRDQIERRRPVRTGDLFHILPRANVVGGQILFRGQAEIFGALSAGQRGVTGEDAEGPAPCPARVFVDGMQQPDHRIDDIHPDEIEAIEAYAGPARLPIQFSGPDSACGVILVWLRDR